MAPPRDCDLEIFKEVGRARWPIGLCTLGLSRRSTGRVGTGPSRLGTYKSGDFLLPPDSRFRTWPLWHRHGVMQRGIIFRSFGAVLLPMGAGTLELPAARVLRVPSPPSAFARECGRYKLQARQGELAREGQGEGGDRRNFCSYAPSGADSRAACLPLTLLGRLCTAIGQ